MSVGALSGPMLATTLGLPSFSQRRAENPQSSSTSARNTAHGLSPGDSGARVGFLESICIRARASATASPRRMRTNYLLLPLLAEAFGFDFELAFTACFLAAGFMVGFLAAGFFAAGAACFTGVACFAAATGAAG